MRLKYNNCRTFTFLVALILLVFVGYIWRDNIRFGIAYGWDNLPTHAPSKGCSWERKAFQKSGISFYFQNCAKNDSLSWTYSEDSDGKIVRTNSLSSRYTMEAFAKQESQSPLCSE